MTRMIHTYLDVVTSRVCRFGKHLITSIALDNIIPLLKSISVNLRTLRLGKAIGDLFLAPPSVNYKKCRKSIG